MYSETIDKKIKKLFVGDFKQSDLNVYLSGHEESCLPAGHINGPIIRDCHVIQYCLCGRAMISIDENTFSIEKGQVCFYFPGTVVLEKCDVNDPPRFIWSYIKGLNIDLHLKIAGITKENPVLHSKNNDNILNFLNQIVYLDDNTDPVSELLRNSYAFGLFAEILIVSQTSNLDANDSVSEDFYINYAIRYIQENFFRNIKVADVAERLGINRSYLFTLFKKSIGISPKEYLMRFQIKKACEFLSNPYATVASVAYSVGSDPKSFSPLFKHILGITPSEYKNRLHSRDNVISVDSSNISHETDPH